MGKLPTSSEQLIMVVMDAWTENWIVEVDKKPRQLLKAGPFKAVLLASGDNQVTFSYKPWWRTALMFYLHFFFGLLFLNILWIYWNFLQKSRICEPKSGDAEEKP